MLGKDVHDKLGLKHYKWAELRLVTGIDKQLSKPRLVFASVHLHPTFVPKPEPMQGVYKPRPNKNKLFFRRVVLTAEHAVSWYENLSDLSKTPTPSEETEVEDSDGSEFLAPSLRNEMQWPSLALPLNESLTDDNFNLYNPAPFCGEANAKLHRKFGDRDGFLHLLEDEVAVDFIERCAHINLSFFPEYLASANLVVPNPLIQKVENFLIKKESSEIVFHRFIPRPNESLKDLTITVYEENNGFITHVETNELPEDGIVELERQHCMGSYGYEVFHESYGLILKHQPTGFLRQVSLSVNIVEKQFQVTVPISAKKKPHNMTYSTNQSRNVSTNTVGDTSIPHNFNARIANANEKRRKVALADKYGQRFFASDSREEAMEFVHNLFAKAKNKILIADPYFSDLQAKQFLYAVSASSVKVEILTSSEILTGNLEERLEKAKSLESSVNKIAEDTEQAISIALLVQKPPILHDRFLMIDNNVWFMGNSLSDLGQRASMVLKVPYPDVVIQELLIIQNQAIELGRYIEDNEA